MSVKPRARGAAGFDGKPVEPGVKKSAHDFDGLAPFLKRLVQHVVWRDEPRRAGDRPSKIPYDLALGKRSHGGKGYSVDPAFWVAFDDAVAAVIAGDDYDGIGTVFGEIPETGESLGGIDLDNCFKPDGSYRDWTVPFAAILKKTYVETSPSGGGEKATFRYRTSDLKAIDEALGLMAGGKSRTLEFVKGTKEEKGQQLELYLGGRFFTETGKHVAGSAPDVVLFDVATFAEIGALFPKVEEKPKATTSEAPTSLDEVTSAVMAIPVDTPVNDPGGIGDLTPRNVWLRIAMGLHHYTEGRDAGFALLRDWSIQSPQFKEKGLADTWKGFKGDRDHPVTIGTIFKIAEYFGWVRVYRVPAVSKMFAGMSHDDLFADIYRIVEQNCRWSVSKRAIMKTDALNDALSGIYRPPVAGWKTQPRNYTDWLKAIHRVATYKGLIYRGGQPPICESAPGAGDEMVNLWQPPPPIPDEIRERVAHEGDAAVELWLTLIADACNDDRRLIDHVLDWFAFVRMASRLKPGWHIIMRTKAFGTGKDMICSMFMLAMGDGNCTMIYRQDLGATFNDWAEKKFGVLEELRTTTRGTMTGGDIFNALQSYTANEPPRFRVNRKHIVPYMADNLIAIVITTNSKAPMTMPEGDRRYLILAGRESVRPKEFYAKCAAWKASPDVGLIISAWLEARWESMSEERRGMVQWHAPASDAKTLMIEATEDPVVAYARAALTTEFGIDAWPDLMSPTDFTGYLRAAVDNGHLIRNATIPPVTRIGRWAIENLGARAVPLAEDGEHLVSHRPDAKTVRLYALRRHDIYAGLSTRELGKLYVEKKIPAMAGAADATAGAKPKRPKY